MSSESTASRLDRSARESRQRAPVAAAAAVAQQEEDYEQEEVEDRENAADNMEDDIEDEVEEGVNGFEADLLEVLEDAQPALEPSEDLEDEEVDLAAVAGAAPAAAVVVVAAPSGMTKVPSVPPADDEDQDPPDLPDDDQPEPSNFAPAGTANERRGQTTDGASGGSGNSWRHHQPTAAGPQRHQHRQPAGQQQHQPQDDYWRDELGLAAAAVAAAAAVVPAEEDAGGMATHQQQAMVNRPTLASSSQPTNSRRNGSSYLRGGGEARSSSPTPQQGAAALSQAFQPQQVQLPGGIDEVGLALRGQDVRGAVGGIGGGGGEAAANYDAHHNNVGLYNWQATKMTVKERLGFLFNSNILSDVTFVVGRGNQVQRIPAHKFVLSVGSAVFDAMFNSTLATRDEEIELPDVEAASFLILLKFLYSDEVQIGPDSVMTTLYTAKKYAVPALEKHCVDFLKRHLCADNAFMLLTQARLFDEPQLAALCLDMIDKATPEALGAEGFTEIDVDTLSAVLDRDSLRIKEAKLFSAVIRWSEAECLRQDLPVISENKRSVLGRVLTQIRFPLMTVEEFAQGPAQSGILTDRECVSLFLHFTVNPKPPVGFLDVPRCSMTGKEQTVSRFQQIESRWGYSGTSDKIRFLVDRRIFVVGFGLYGSIHGPSEYQATIQISHTTSGRVLGSNQLTFSSDGTNATFRVMFKDPVEILPATNYTASATLKGLDSHYGTKGLRKVSVECSTGGKVTFNFSYAAGNNNGTSIEDGQIPEIIFYT